MVKELKTKSIKNFNQAEYILIAGEAKKNNMTVANFIVWMYKKIFGKEKKDENK